MTRTGTRQRREFPPLTESFSAGVLPLTIAHILRPKQVLSLLAASVPGLVLASPQGGQVVGGSASISSPNTNTTNIHQASNRAAIDWQSFSLGSSDYVQFFQPNSSSVALNRVVGGNPSSILGNLTANGQVFLVNPAGVYFGQGATVDVAGLVATTMNIDTDDFMGGNYLFNRDIASPDNASVINEGILAAREGGYVVLSGDYVDNSGIISARLGTVALAAGAGMTLDIAGDDLINFTVDAATVSSLAGVNNSGDLYADGGRVIMTAEVADNLVNAAVNNSGRAQAQGVVEQGGAIYLVAEGGDIVNSGVIDASGPSGDGGFVRVRSTDDVTLTSTSEINATGGAGEGGIVRVIAEENLDFKAGADIDVRGAAGEQGGFVEVSGHGGLRLKGHVQVGNNGQLLVDPAKLTVSAGGSIGPTGSSASANIGELFVEGLLQSGANVALVASNSISFSSGLFGGGLDGTFSSSGGDLFIGIGSISVGSSLGFFSNTLPSSFAGGIPPNYTPDPSGSITLNGNNITVDGDLTLQAGTVSGDISSMASVSGNNVTISAAGGSISDFSDHIQINAANNVAIAANLISVSSSGTGSGADLSIVAGGSVDIDADINVFASSGGSGGSGVANLSVTGVGINIDGVGPSPSILVEDGGGSFSNGATITLNAGSGNLSVAADVQTNVNQSFAASSSAVNTQIQYTGANVTQVGNLTASASFSGLSSATSSVAATANVTLTATSGSVTVSDGIVTANALASISGSTPASGSANATAGVTISATSGSILFNNADLLAQADASNAQGANSAASPTARAVADVQLSTNTAGGITFTAGTAHNGDITAAADARATGSSSSSVTPVSLAGARIGVIGEDSVTIDGQVLAVADGDQVHGFPSSVSGADVHIQSRTQDVVINNSVQAVYGLGAGVNAQQAVARVQLMTGFVTGPSSSFSYHSGGDITLNAGASVLASAEAKDVGIAEIDIWAV